MTIEISNRIDYIKYDEESIKIQEHLKLRFKFLMGSVDQYFENSREKALALTALEESWMWIGKCIKVDQIERLK